MILELSLQISEVSHDSVSVVFALDDETSSTVRYLMIRFSSVFKRLSLIVRVNVVLNRSVVVDSD